MSQAVYDQLDHFTWIKLRSWARWRHPRKSIGWVTRRYWHRLGTRLTFTTSVTDPNTDDCNLSCGYCTEFIPGAPPVPLPTLQARVDQLDALGVMVYDLLGGEPLLHPDLAEIIRYIKAKRHNGNLVVLITNGFLLTSKCNRC